MTPLDPKYIKMFNHPKIQERWRIETGDRYVEYDNKQPILRLVTVDEDADTLPFLGDYIFLPSIEQMAKMFLEAKRNVLGWKPTSAFFFREVGYFSGMSNLFDDAWPLPIIVLAFIMHDLYSLTWDEGKGKWV